ncbi:FecCD family ABC transporter permease [Parvularcula lutaonensis]|uniref:FecCD family ABC transporter permease n=1 Tax=Parvularcula lutaonensis TaxID=491923 RepID=A0ABV7M906_9PROT|nr:iron ABC transporter permease [Parvularcula lutaonensis]GGY56244.1 ABC transporter permease [Parvularcula lutaonensis]
MSRDLRLSLTLLTMSLAAFFAAILLGPTPLSPVRALAGLFGQGPSGDNTVIQLIRAPRAVAAFLTGGSLALAGAALQGLLRNPLAEPGVLGVTASSIFGATLVIYFGVASAGPAVPIAAVAGALAATALISVAAIRLRSVATLILFGIGLSSFIGALMSLLLSLAPTPFTLMEMVNWTFGSVANRSWQDIALAAPFMAAGGALVLLARRGYTALTLGEDAAAAAGLDLQKHRLLTVLGTGLLTGASVSLAGGIGFVGIVAPHIVRPLTGHDPGASLAPSFLAGGLLLTLADIAIRLLPGTAELRLGVLAALIGAPVFVLISLRRRGGL